MRIPALALALCACTVLAGCSKSGDFGAFVVAEVGRHGGHARTNAPLPKLPASWRARSSEGGFRATVTGVNFTNVEQFLSTAFGRPKLCTEGPDTPGGMFFRVWGAMEGGGVAIELMCLADNKSEIQCAHRIRDFKEVTEPITEVP